MISSIFCSDLSKASYSFAPTTTALVIDFLLLSLAKTVSGSMVAPSFARALFFCLNFAERPTGCLGLVLVIGKPISPTHLTA